MTVELSSLASNSKAEFASSGLLPEMTSLFGFLPFCFLLPLLPNQGAFLTNHMDTNPPFSVCF